MNGIITISVSIYYSAKIIVVQDQTYEHIKTLISTINMNSELRKL